MCGKMVDRTPSNTEGMLEKLKVSFGELIDDFNKFKADGPKIITLGYTGVGKSSFITKILGASRTETDISTKSPTDRSINIDEKYVVIIDTPGNEAFFNKLKPSLKKEIDRVKSVGLINVVSFGYNDSRSRDIYGPSKPETFDKNNKINEKFLSWQRDEDLLHLKKCMDEVIFPEHVSWVLTIINKAELWFDKKELVDQYYGIGGDYRNALIDIFGEKMRFETVYACAEEDSIIERGHTVFHKKILPVVNEVQFQLTGMNKVAKNKIGQLYIDTGSLTVQ